MKKFFYFLILAIILISCASEPKIRLTCIGDSITEGAGVKDLSKHSYPSVLAAKLGAKYEVLNCGQGGATMLQMSDHPYVSTNEWYNAQMFSADITLIALGTNDSKDHNWNQNRFEQDYRQMVSFLKKLNPEMKVYVCLPPPAFNHSWGINDSTIQDGVIPVIKRIAQENGLKVIDFNSPLKNKQDLFPDGIHPDEEGAAFLAELIAKEL